MTEVEYVAGSIEAAAEFSAGTPSWAQRSRAQPTSPATTVARTMAMTAPPTAAPPPGQAPDDGGGVVMPGAGEAMPDDEKLRRFRTMVDHVNERVRRAVGMDVFAEIEHLGGGAVALTATKAWLAAPEAARQANLQTLSRRWGAVHEPHAPIAVRIVNDRGEVMMEERRSGAPAALSSVDG